MNTKIIQCIICLKQTGFKLIIGLPNELMCYTYYVYVFLQGQPRLALLFCWYHLPNFTIFHVISCYVFVNFNLNLVINAFIYSFNCYLLTRLDTIGSRYWTSLVLNVMRSAWSVLICWSRSLMKRAAVKSCANTHNKERNHTIRKFQFA